MNRANRRTIRTLLQLIAAGGLTGVVTAVASGLSVWVSSILFAVNILGVTYAQNYLEQTGVVPVFLPAPVEKPPLPPA